CSSLSADGGQSSTEQARGSPFRSIWIETQRRSLHNALTPAALRHEHFILGILKMLVDEKMPGLQIHGVILANSEALFLMRANHVADQVAEQSPIGKPALPRLHGVVVGAAVETHGQQALERFFGEKERAPGRQHALHLQ